MTSEAPCVFCQIIKGEQPESSVYSDHLVPAFMDIQPVNSGHDLIIPRRHTRYLEEVKETTARHMFAVAQRIALAVRTSGVQCEGVNLFLADGEAAGQEVFHTHLHVIPRFSGDGFGFRFGSHYEMRPSRQELDAVRAKIRTQLESAG